MAKKIILGSGLETLLDSKNAYAQMNVSGTHNNTSGIVNSWTSPISSGGFEARPSNSYIYIPKGTKTIEIGGAVGGSGNSWSYIIVKDFSTTNSVANTHMLHQSSGNGYWFHGIPNKIIQLDETKAYYVVLECNGYNGTFNLNSGFGSNSFIYARKLK